MSLTLPPWPPQWPEIEDSVVEAVRDGDWGRYFSRSAQRLRERICEHFAVEHVRLLPSGTAGIELSLRLGRVGPDDEVMLAAYDYPGNLRSVELLGAKPVLVDVREDGGSIDPVQLEAAAGEKTKAVIVSHLYGNPANIREVLEICNRHRWVLIEDACQVPGMHIEGRPAGSWGTFGVLSFGGSKPLTAGNGGAILVRDDRVAARFGAWLDRPSDALPLSPLQAAALIPQFDHLDSLNALRESNSRRLLRDTSNRLPRWRALASFPSDPAFRAAHYKFAWLAETEAHRERIVRAAAEIGLPVGPGFRSTATLSGRRCRKPVPLIQSEEFGRALFLLDHSALMVEEKHYEDLLQALVELHDRSQ